MTAESVKIPTYCELSGCSRPALSCGLCQTHYAQVHRGKQNASATAADKEAFSRLQKRGRAVNAELKRRGFRGQLAIYRRAHPLPSFIERPSMTEEVPATPATPTAPETPAEFPDPFKDAQKALAAGRQRFSELGREYLELRKRATTLFNEHETLKRKHHDLQIRYDRIIAAVRGATDSAETDDER